jgi:hypothetical protein
MPFLALRSYLPADHPDKGKEIGSEATPAAFLSTLLALTREWRRLLAPHGSLCVELGDTYSGAGGGDAALSYRMAINGERSKGGKNDKRDVSSGWPLDKSLCLLPTLYPASLAYGWNMLNPDDRIEPLRVRNLIVWHRPNPPVGALGDKVRPSTSYVTVACVRRDRWFDLDAERVAPDPTTGRSPGVVSGGSRGGVGRGRLLPPGSQGDGAHQGELNGGSNPAGAPPLDHWQLDEDDPVEHESWTIPTQPYAGSHYATFPIALPRRLIRLMCPMHVCRQCGEPRRRIVGEAEYVPSATNRGGILKRDGERTAEGVNQWINGDGAQASVVRTAPTLGWSDCGHDNYRRGRVLDPFAGSGTTLAAATEQGRDATGIDIDADNYWLARQRIGLFLQEPA